MPTYELEALFLRQFAGLTDEQTFLVGVAMARFIADVRAGQGFRRGLRIRGLARRPGEYELTWAPDGRAVFRYGDSVRDGETHVVWLRIGSHDVLDA